ncbi:DUF58 domain-containing protein [Shewanella amazonensis]|uniref:DUF58 domain-containing protein n=1 Tax=Shewanella amazonensis (strain ATCC BAA-1098 / SB2B) TaxID=326297 RepID=A1S7L9_SHEAM|nr:DUF58 domain-containing protein [Shewanella amazonensis]ABM00376.1 conserved hypothetical protein [Shewanella amazonensis SB2B]
MRAPKSERKASALSLPLFADGVHLDTPELLACQELARALPDVRSQARASMAGHRASQIKGRGMEFAEVRQYQKGDDVRTIDWRVTARTGKTHTKLFVEERERPVLLLVDLSHSLYFGSTLMLQAVQLCHLATTLGWRAIGHGDRIGALIASEHEHLELKPRSRKSGMLQLISALTEVHRHQLTAFDAMPRDPEHLLRACQRLERIAKPGSLIWLLSDGSGFSESCVGPLMNLKRHCELGAFLVTDPLRDGRLPLADNLALPVREAGKEKLLDRRGYQAWLERQKEQTRAFEHLTLRLGIPLKTIDSGQPLSAQLDILR